MNDDDVVIFNVTLKEYLMDTINERDRKYEQRFGSIDKTISELNESLKEALKTALQTTGEALEKATANTASALQTANENIKSAREQLSTQQETFARKDNIEANIAYMKEAVIKAETATEKRFESVNEFRNQMADMQQKLAVKSEMDIRFNALDDKLATAIDTTNRTEALRGGNKDGMYMLIIGVGWLISIITPIILHFIH
jgi:hypothetical protein